MKIRSLVLYRLVLPLRQAFRHASHQRSSSDSFVVRAELSDGTIGFGEGVPREYVTGETIDSCFAFLAGMADRLSACRWSEYAEMVEWLWDMQEHAPERPPSFAARCALETALLDAGGRTWRCAPAEVFAALPDLRQLLAPRAAVRYSGVVSQDDATRTWRTGLKFRLYGFRDVKVKVGTDADADALRLRTLRRWLGRSVRLRVDANGSWSAQEAGARMRQMAELGVEAVEQPLAREDSPRLAELRGRTKVAVVLDESLVSARDAMVAIDGKWGDVFNLRLSKCGGFLACLKLADLARKAGLACQLGCHPGETAILSAAGRHFAAALGGLRWLEGSYDRHVLTHNVIDGDVTFGWGGKARALVGPGLGIKVNQEKVEALAARTETLGLA